MDEFNQLQLEAHNGYRSLHQAYPLKYDAKLADQAQEWADELNRTGRPKHDPNKDGAGENIAWGTINFATSSAATDMWYEEVSKYDYNNPGYQKGTGHFTQIVWKDSEKLGCGISGSFVVCRYKPQGNFGFEKDYQANVLPK